MVTIDVFAVTGIRCHTQYLARSVTLDTAVSLPRTSRILENTKHENRDALERLTADELQMELEKVRHITPRNHPDNGSAKRKRGRAEERLLFTRRSTLWDLEYRNDLDLRHNLHIKKNICDNIIGKFLNIEGKTKDTLKSRIDLTHLGIRKDSGAR